MFKTFVSLLTGHASYIHACIQSHRYIHTYIHTLMYVYINRFIHSFIRRVRLKPDGTRWRTGGEVKGKMANGVGSQYPSHYLGTWCIQHYYRWCLHLGCQQSTELTPPPIYMDSSVSPKDENWFLRGCHHISNAVYDRWFKHSLRTDDLCYARTHVCGIFRLHPDTH
jgi:hypothetical protein